MSEEKSVITDIAILMFVPPLAAYRQVGKTKHFWINLGLLCCCCGVGSMGHALWLKFTDQKGE